MIKKTNGFLEEYYRKCKAREIIVGLEMMMTLENLMEEINSEDYIYDTAEPDYRIQFMEGCVRLTKSPYYGKPMILMLWQKAMISAFYGVKCLDGTDKYKEIMLLIARKNTKSETAAGLALAELIVGPAGADIVCSSNDDKQASIIYEAIDTMRKMIDPRERRTGRNQQRIINRRNNTKVFKLSDRTRNKEGHNIDFGILDEEHEMKTNTIVKSIQQSQSLKINPKLIHITTEGFVNDGFLDNELIKARKILNKETTGLFAESYLPWLYTQDSEAEIFQDPMSWYKSNPTLDVIKRRRYLEEQVDLAKESRTDRIFVFAKDFNIKQSSAQSWLDLEDYDYPCAFDLEDFRGAICLGAVDLAQTTDLACAKILLMKAGSPQKFIHTRYFIPEIKLTKANDTSSGAEYKEWVKDGFIHVTPGNDIDLEVIADWFFSLFKIYKIRLLACGYDVKFAKQWLKRMDDYGFTTEMVYQNGLTMTNANKLLEADLKSKFLYYNDNPVDKWCFKNTSIQITDNLGNFLLAKMGDLSTRRIDGTVTAAILYEMYRRFRSEFHNMLK